MDLPFKKRGKWCVRSNGTLRKFVTEELALEFLGIKAVEPQLDLFDELDELEGIEEVEEAKPWFSKRETSGS